MNKSYRSLPIFLLAFGMLCLGQAPLAWADPPTPSAIYAVPTGANGTAGDLPIEIIDNLFGVDAPTTGQSTADQIADLGVAQADGTTGNPNNSGVVQAGMRTLLLWYSYGMLVLGTFVLLYYLLRIIAETAHTGKVGGGANQLWGPIRTVLAIAMLVPLSSGLNAGQMIVVNIATEGSALASNAWSAFENNLVNATPVPPPIQNQTQAVYNLYLIHVCMDAYNEALTSSGASNLIKAGWTVSESGPTPLTSFDGAGNSIPTGKEAILYGNSLDAALCGKVTLPMASANDPSTLAAGDILTAFNDMEHALDGGAENGGIIGGPTSPFIVAALQQSPTAASPDASLLSYNGQTGFAALQALGLAYDRELTTALTNAVTANTGQANTMAVLQNAANSPYGWLGAGTMFVELGRLQGQLLASAESLPEVSAPVINAPTSTPKGLIGNTLGWMGNVWNSAFGSDAENKTAKNNSFLDLVANAMAYAKATVTVNKKGGNLPTYVLNSPGNSDAETTSGTSLPNRIFGTMDVSLVYGVLDMIGSNTNSPLLMLETEGHLLLGLAMVGIIASCTSAATVLGESLGPLFGAVGLATLSPLLINGILLAFVLPFIPLIRFFFAVCAWLLAFAEAVISAPIFALAHLDPYSQGILPQKGAGGYMLLMHLLFRPILIVAGLILALLMMNTLVGLFNMMFVATLFNNAGGQQSGFVSVVGSFAGGGFIAPLVYLFMHSAVCYTICNYCFKAIDYVPNHAMRWIGGGGDTHDGEQHHRNMTSAAVAVAGAGQSIQGMKSNIASAQSQQTQGKIDQEFLSNPGSVNSDWVSPAARLKHIQNQKQLPQTRESNAGTIQDSRQGQLNL